MARVTDGLLYNKADRAMNRTRTKMMENQEQAVTGRRINKPSDNPQGMVRAIGLKTKIDRNEQSMKNMEIANSYLGVTDSSLAELSNVLSRAKELAVQMSNSSNQSPDAMRAVQSEADELFYQALQIGNTRVGEHYIFAGYQTERPPFDENGNYYGDLGQIQIEVQPGQKVPLNVTGLKPFMGLDEIPKRIAVEGEEEGDESQAAVPAKLQPVLSRDPASLIAESRQIDPKENPEAFAQIQQSVGVNIFQSLKTFSQGLKEGRPELIHQTLDNIDKAFSQVLETRATVGALQNAVVTNTDLVDAQQVTNQLLKSNVVDADTTQVYSDLARNEALLNSTLQANKKLLTPSLLDFLK
ncbi:MAG: flagellar hook-associated protein FlgL [Bdellovibrionota bacterium]